MCVWSMSALGLDTVGEKKYAVLNTAQGRCQHGQLAPLWQSLLVIHATDITLRDCDDQSL